MQGFRGNEQNSNKMTTSRPFWILYPQNYVLPLCKNEILFYITSRPVLILFLRNLSWVIFV